MPPLVITVKRLTRAEAEADLTTTTTTAAAAPAAAPPPPTSLPVPSSPPLHQVRYRLRRPGAAPGIHPDAPPYQPRHPSTTSSSSSSSSFPQRTILPPLTTTATATGAAAAKSIISYTLTLPDVEIIIPDDSKCWTFKLVHSCGHAASRGGGGGGGSHERKAVIQVKQGEHWGPCCALRGCERKWGRLELGMCDMCELRDSGCELIPR